MGVSLSCNKPSAVSEFGIMHEIPTEFSGEKKELDVQIRKVRFQVNLDQDHRQHLVKVPVQSLKSGFSPPLPSNTNHTRANGYRPAPTFSTAGFKDMNSGAGGCCWLRRGLSYQMKRGGRGVFRVEHITQPQWPLNWRPHTPHSSVAG